MGFITDRHKGVRCVSCRPRQITSSYPAVVYISLSPSSWRSALETFFRPAPFLNSIFFASARLARLFVRQNDLSVRSFQVGTKFLRSSNLISRSSVIKFQVQQKTNFDNGNYEGVLQRIKYGTRCELAQLFFSQIGKKVSRRAF